MTMPSLRLVRVAASSLGFGLCAASALADSTASGSFMSTNMHATFIDVYAYRTTDDSFGESKEVTEVVISDQPLDKRAIAEAVNNRGEDSTTSVLWDKIDGAFAKLTIDAEAYVQLYLYVPPGYNLNMAGFEGAEIAVNTAERIEGSVRIDDSDSDDPYTIELAFAADLDDQTALGGAAAAASGETEAAAEVQGDPLPPGGGEPGKVFQDAMAAQRAGDVDTMLKLSNQETRTRMLAEREKPEFPEMVEMLKQMTPAETIVTGGFQDGETATLEFDGKYTDGTLSKGTARLSMEDGAWVIEEINETIGGTE
jgi:hypothetical protein